MASMLGLHNIQVNTADLANGHSIAAYLTDAAGALITSTLLAGKQRADVQTSAEFAESSTHVSGDYGQQVLGVRNDAGTPLAADGEYIPLSMDANGNLRVNASIDFAGDYAEDSPHTSGDIGLFNLSVRRDTRSSGTSADGDYASFNTNAVGELWVKDADVLARLVLINSDTTAILADTATIDAQTLAIQNLITALSKSEDVAAASGDQGIQALLVRQDTLASSTSADGDYGSFKSNAAGELYVTDAALRTLFTALTKAEDAPHASGDQGIQALAVRRDSEGSNVGTDGDYSSLLTWSEGSLKVVDISNGSILQQQVSVTSTAAAVPTAALTNRKSLMLQNTSLGKIWIGSATVTSSGATAGIELPASSFMELEVGPAVSVFAIKAGVGSLNLNVLEMA